MYPQLQEIEYKFLNKFFLAFMSKAKWFCMHLEVILLLLRKIMVILKAMIKFEIYKCYRIALFWTRFKYFYHTANVKFPPQVTKEILLSRLDFLCLQPLSILPHFLGISMPPFTYFEYSIWGKMFHLATKAAFVGCCEIRRLAAERSAFCALKVIALKRRQQPLCAGAIFDRWLLRRAVTKNKYA